MSIKAGKCYSWLFQGCGYGNVRSLDLSLCYQLEPHHLEQIAVSG